MNENLNLCETLKGVPRGTMLWCDYLDRYVMLLDVDSTGTFPVKIQYKGDDRANYIMLLSKGGKLVQTNNARCIIFPEKNKSWEDFEAPWKHKVFSPFTKVLVKSADTGAWEAAMYNRYAEDLKLHRTIDGLWYKDKDILLYKGNENKLGKE